MKKPSRFERVSLYKGPDPVGKMKISAIYPGCGGLIQRIRSARNPVRFTINLTVSIIPLPAEVAR